MANSPRAFLLLYGSEKGQAESIAQDVADAAAAKGCNANLFVLNDVDRKFFLEKTRLPVVIITSTTGEGDPPENARKFDRRIRRKTLSPSWLAHLRFSVLGLGDSNYTNFCNCGKSIDRRLAELGASRFYPSAWADDGVGLDLTVDPWLEGLWPALDAFWASQEAEKEPEAPAASEELQNGHASTAEAEEAAAELAQDFSRLSVAPTAALVGEEAAAAQGLPGLASLSLPAPSPAFLRLQTLPPGAPGIDLEASDPARLCPKFALPSAAPGAQGLLPASVEAVETLSGPDAVKRCLLCRIRVDLSAPLAFGPGDSLGLVAANPHAEVAALLERLGVASADADRPLRFSVLPDTANRRAAVPGFVPAEGASLRQLLTNFLDIRAAPDKLLLRVLAEHTSAEPERRRLLELCSSEGRQLYQAAVRDEGLTLLDLLRALPSCRPPAARIVERLKQLMPRPYSACCAPAATGDPSSFEFAANLVEVPEGRHRAARRGLFTGWLADLADSGQRGARVWVYLRRNDAFRPPPTPGDGSQAPPMVMIGPGTGVAPFRGFLQQLAREGPGRPAAWLFFGCRHRARDWLFEEEMQAWHRDGVLDRLSVAFSRDEAEGPRYVQDCMRAERAELARWLREHQAVVYVCGDARNMAKDVRECITKILTEDCADGDAKEGERLFARMRLDRKYVEDVWS